MFVIGMKGELVEGGDSQVADFVGGDDDAAEAARVLDDRHAVHLLQALVHLQIEFGLLFFLFFLFRFLSLISLSLFFFLSFSL